MSSLIPKISIGRDTKRNHFDLSCMTHTTSEIGYVQPTFGRTIVPKSKVRVATRTGSRLSPLFVPTMGKIDIRHYHCFVPYSTIWTPFDSFLTQQNYTLPTGETYVPTNIPYFNFRYVFNTLLQGATEYESGYDPHEDLTCGFVNGGSLLTDEEYTTLKNADSGNTIDYILSHSVVGIYFISAEGTIWMKQKNGSKWSIVPLEVSGEDLPAAVKARRELAFPSATNFDYMDNIEDSDENTHLIVYNFNGGLKRLRTIFMGLGYSFNPFDTQVVTPLKLLSFYKAYYALFGVNRERNFYNTYCYKCIKYLSENIVSDMSDIISYPVLVALFINFIRLELSKCTYTCPVDYFSAADTTTQRGSYNANISSEVTGFNAYGEQPAVGAASFDGAPVEAISNSSRSSTYALAIQMASRLMRFVNKNSVIGRKISEILRARYGVTDLHNETHESIIRVGASSTDIEIAAIYSNTETADMPLGGYAGAGMSSRQNANSKSFTFETKEFGCLITLTAVVPKMGYFQGMLRENSDGCVDSSEWWTPEFDALGWQSVRYNELVADRMMNYTGVSNNGTELGTWGYLPRMTHLKCSFNRCLGDISIPHMQDSMLPYTLDRFFLNRKINDSGGVSLPALPVNEAQSFRSGTQGQTNRIFTDMSPTDDHVIMQIFFDIKMAAPMKSISTSFDTWDEESEQSVDVAHE